VNPTTSRAKFEILFKSISGKIFGHGDDTHITNRREQKNRRSFSD
jgi:hypothetical protein